MTRRTPRQRRSHAELVAQLAEIETWFESYRAGRAMPRAWRRIERDVPTRPRKTRVTAALDADVVTFFRAMGQGYQARMNAVLRSFMLARLSGEIPGRWED
jgi:uncharacterized protein (DUF4415 family)